MSEDQKKEASMRIVATLRGKGAHLSFDEAVKSFPGGLMNTAPDNVPYSFWHQIEHIRICQWDILRYVIDPSHVSPEFPGGYWPQWSLEADRPAWDATIAGYHADLEELISLITHDETDILAPVAHNAGRSILGSALVIADHTTYHLGEFVMGRQILGAWQSML